MDWSWIPGFPWPEWIAKAGAALCFGGIACFVGKIFEDQLKGD